MKKFYITTPLYYVNAEPHIGHAYTNIAADVLARYKRMKGYQVYFLTGTDEHGQKVQRAAEERGYQVKEFCDQMVKQFIALWDLLKISYDDFIRTTEERHENAVKKVLQYLYNKGDIYLGDYVGWYCTPCETFWTKTQLENKKLCPDCKRPLEAIAEKNYFFRVSAYQDWLITYFKENKNFVLPATRYNEVFSLLQNPLNDLCVTRPMERLNWGIPLPFSPAHVTYVWFDALLNYITAPGYGKDMQSFAMSWPADVHFIGKDILRYHAIYWPIMLKALDIEPPRLIFAHGWWLVEKEGGEVDKMSKSKGNIVDPRYLVEKYGVDALRYFLLREVPFGQDGSFSEKLLIKRINSDLANDYGNLVYRTLNMLAKYFNSRIPESTSARESIDVVFRELVYNLDNKIEQYFAQIDYQAVLIEIWEIVKRANKYIEDKAPWRLAQEDKDALCFVLYTLIEILRIVTLALAPFMPESSQRVWYYLGFKEKISKYPYCEVSQWGILKPGSEVIKGVPLFPRIAQ